MRDYRFLRDAHVFAGLGGENEEVEANWRLGDATYRLNLVRVTDDFFSVTGIPVALGRRIQPGDSDTVVVTHGFWQARLAGDPNVVGRVLLLDGRPHTVAGVLPRDHRTVTGFGFSPDLYATVNGAGDTVSLYARLYPGMGRPQAYTRLRIACEDLDRLYPQAHRKMARGLRITGIVGMERIGKE